MGRPSKYTEDLPEKMIKFFSRPLARREIIETIHFKNGGSKDVYGYIPNDPPWFSDFCYENGFSQIIMDKWVSEKSKYFKEDLFIAYKRAKELQKQFIICNSMAQRTNSAMSIFTLKNISEMRDEQHLKHQGAGNTYINIWNKT